MIKIGINGFGRIGRLVLRNLLSRTHFQVVLINDVVDINYIAYMFKYDSTHGKFDGDIQVKENYLLINKHKIYITLYKEPKYIPWYKYNVDIVIESTGIFTSKEFLDHHIIYGKAKKVILTAPTIDVNIPMYVMGVNNIDYQGELIVSNASCTTNCLAPILKVLHMNVGIVEGFMTTIHAATATQKVVDSQSLKDWRGGRSVFNNIIPSTTGAANAIGSIIPDLKGKITGMSFRVPTNNVSVVDVTLRLINSISYEKLCQYMLFASQHSLFNILGYIDEYVVSSDINGMKLISIFDAKASMVLNDKFIKVVSWYDNEVGYADKVLDLALYIYNYISINN